MLVHTVGLASDILLFSTALIVVTMLFNGYIRQEHFRVADVLPSNECLKMDLRRGLEEMDTGFLVGAYLQDEMQDKELFPEDMDEKYVSRLDLYPTVVNDEENMEENEMGMKTTADEKEDNRSFFQGFFSS